MITLPKAARDTAIVVIAAAALVAGFGPQAHDVAAQAPTTKPIHPQMRVKVPQEQPPVKAAGPITVAAVGDSITDWSTAIHNHGYDLTRPITRPWSTDLDGPVALSTDDGWAESGHTLEDMAAGILPIHSKVLVIMGGTNDLGTLGRVAPAYAIGRITPSPVMRASLETIITRAQAPHCVISAIAPSNLNPVGAASWNLLQAKVAGQRGCSFVDPWSTIRATDGTFMAGWTLDGVHPNDAASLIASIRLTRAIESSAASTPERRKAPRAYLQ